MNRLCLKITMGLENKTLQIRTLHFNFFLNFVLTCPYKCPNASRIYFFQAAVNAALLKHIGAINDCLHSTRFSPASKEIFFLNTKTAKFSFHTNINCKYFFPLWPPRWIGPKHLAFPSAKTNLLVILQCNSLSTINKTKINSKLITTKLHQSKYTKNKNE